MRMVTEAEYAWGRKTEPESCRLVLLSGGAALKVGKSARRLKITGGVVAPL